MTVWTLPEHREHHFWPGVTYDDCAHCIREAQVRENACKLRDEQTRTTPSRDHRDDGNPMPFLITWVLLLATITTAVWAIAGPPLSGRHIVLAATAALLFLAARNTIRSTR